MIYRDFQKSFEIFALRFINVADKPTSSEIEFWLDRGKDKYVKTRYSGINYKKEGFEESQKRIDDLQTLIREATYEASSGAIRLPSDYMFMLGETVGILPNTSNQEAIDCWPKDISGNLLVQNGDVLEATIENIDRQLSNSLSEHILHRSYARPLRLIQNNNVKFYTDGSYYVKDYKLTYLKKPSAINLHIDPKAEYTDMPEHTHEEIVKLAVEMFLENRQNPRYQTFLAEVGTME